MVLILSVQLKTSENNLLTGKSIDSKERVYAQIGVHYLANVVVDIDELVVFRRYQKIVLFLSICERKSNLFVPV